MNVQVLTDLFGQLLWASPPPGSIHDLTAARTHGVIEALTEAELKCWVGKAYQGAGGLVRVPFRGRRLKGWKRLHNSSHTKNPLPRRAGHCHSQGLAPPAEAPLQHQQVHRHRESHPRPSSRINVRLEKAHCPLPSNTGV